MEITKLIETVESSTEYKEWKKQTPTSFLAHAFTMFEKEEEIQWQLGYYNPEHDKIKVFFQGDEIKSSPENEVLKTGKKITKLDLSQLETEWEEALEKSKEVNKEKYPTESAFKYMMLLQESEQGLIWNVTIVMRTFKTLNIQINAKTGSVIKESLEKLFEGAF